MTFKLPNVEFSSIGWYSNTAAGGTNGGLSYGMCGLNITVQGPEDPNFIISGSVSYDLPEDTPSYLVAYQRCYEHLKNSMNLSPDQLDQLEQWNQRIVDEVNSFCAKAGLPAPDLTANDWSDSAPFLNEYAVKTGSYQGCFQLGFGDAPSEPESGF